MKSCTFFGHRDTPESVETLIKDVLVYLIENEKVEKFLVGGEGSFDAMVIKVLNRLKSDYPHIDYEIAIAYLEVKNRKYQNEKTIYPEGLELVPKRFAIEYRNKWLLKQSDFVVTYVNRSFGGAAKFVELAKRQGLTVINLAK